MQDREEEKKIFAHRVKSGTAKSALIKNVVVIKIKKCKIIFVFLVFR
jgi:hypothetical protein